MLEPMYKPKSTKVPVLSRAYLFVYTGTAAKTHILYKKSEYPYFATNMS